MSSRSLVTNDRAVEALVNVLPRGVDIRRPETSSNSGAVTIGGRPVTLRWAGAGSLAEVRQGLASWASAPDVVVAKQLSPGARAVLSDTGIGWVDETGAAEIAIGSIVISRTGRPPEKVAKPPHWTPSVLAVAEALLCGTRGTVASAQEATGLSTGSCTNALRTLTDLGLIETSTARGRGAARHVVDRRALLAAYATAAAARRPSLNLSVGVAWRDPVAGLAETGRKWDQDGLGWAATGTAAAGVLAPYLGSVTSVDVYVDTETIIGLEAAATSAGLNPIEGGRLTLRPFPTVAVERLAVTVDDLRIAPWPRVYADLLLVGVRGEEAAEHLWETIDAR